MSDTGQVTPNQDAPAGEAAAPDPVAALNTRFDEFTNEFKSSLETGFNGIKEAFQPEPEPDPDPWAQLAEPDYGEHQDLYANETPDISADTARQILEHTIQTQVGPIQQKLQEIELRSAAEQIAQQIPALRDPETVQQAYQSAQQLAHQIGQPELANNPHFIKQTYLAGLAQAQAAQETPAGGPDEVRLDGPGGVAPGGVSTDEIGDRIVNSARGLPF